MTSYADLMFTEAVEAEQEKLDAKGKFASRYNAKQDEPLSPREAEFLVARTTLYMASVNTSGWPYVQHRGGPAGFIKVLDGYTLAFADYTGNRQVITKGNLAGDDRVSLFAMDYARKARLKLQGRATMVDASQDPELATRLHVEGEGRVERVMTIRIAAWDWNCPKYITQRFDTAEITALIGPEMSRLETENAALKAEIANLRNAT